MGGFLGPGPAPDDAVPVKVARGEAYLSRGQFKVLDAVSRECMGKPLDEVIDAKIHIIGEEVAD